MPANNDANDEHELQTLTQFLALRACVHSCNALVLAAASWILFRGKLYSMDSGQLTSRPSEM